MNADGSDAHLLPVNGAVCCYAASLTPDGRQLLFAGERVVYVAGRDGNSPRTIWSSPTQNVTAATWSPSGAEIAFSVDRLVQAGPAVSDLYVIDADGRRQHRIATGVAVHALAWSPDGSQLAFLQNQGDIWVVPTRGGPVRSLFGAAQGQGGNELPVTLSWAPARTLLFEETGQAPDGVWQVNPDGSDPHSLLPSGHSPSWGPGGTEFAAVLGGRVVLATPTAGVRASIGPTNIRSVQWGDGNQTGPPPSPVSSTAPPPYTWHMQSLDDVGANHHGSAAVVYLGNPHLFYRDDAGRLHHTYWTGSKWVSETLDSDAGYGNVTPNAGPVAALTWSGQLHVFYAAYVRTALGIGCTSSTADCVAATDVYGLKHMWFANGSWHTDWLVQDNSRFDYSDSVGDFITAVNFLGNPHVFWTGQQQNGTTLRHTWWTGHDWQSEILDGVPDMLTPVGPNGRTTEAVGQGISAAVDGASCLHVFYEQIAIASNASTRHGWFCSGGDWHLQTLDGTGGEAQGAVDRDVSSGGTAALTWGGRVHFFEMGGNGLRHCYSTGHNWTCQTLDPTGFISVGDNGSHAVSAINYLGNPHVFYQWNGDLQHFWWTGSAWAGPETLDKGPTLQNVGDDGTPFIWAGQLHVAYLSTANGLKQAWYGP